MLEQRALHFERTDAIPRADDHIVGPTDEPEIPVGIAIRRVAGAIAVAVEAGCGRLRILPILAKERRRAPAYRYLAGFTGGDLDGVLIDDAHDVAGDRFAHRTGTHEHARLVRHEDDAFGLPVAVVNGQIERFFPRVDHFRIQRFARRSAVAQLWKMEARQVLLDQ